VDKFWNKRGFATVSVIFLSISILAAPANSATKVTTVKQMLAALSVKPEVSSGYVRAKFKHWIDADKDSCDTRKEVLISESTVKVTTGSSCKVTSGKWKSSYDGTVTTDPSTFDIDHFVPLKEAWESGANRWDTATRTAFANDLSYGGSLIAVTASSNRSKSDRDPQNWMPTKSSYHCKYVATWIAVKYRWQLSVNTAEKTFLAAEVKSCGSKATVAIPKRAQVVKAKATEEPNPNSGTSGNDPQFGTCADAKAADYGPYYRGKDPEYYWYRDGDKDGIACE
jgi:hypothetical protein